MLKNETINLNKKDSSITLLSKGDASTLYRLSDGRIVKIIPDYVLYVYDRLGIKFKDKLEALDILSDVEGINLPKSVIMENNRCIGYTYEYIDGISWNDYTLTLTDKDKLDLSKYLELHRKLNTLVKKCNDRGVVIPDLISCDNILISKDKDLSLIDLDGMQVGDYPTFTISTSLGNQKPYYENKKYCKDRSKVLFTNELDKKSLMLLFFLDVLNKDLNKVGVYNPFTGKKVTLDDILSEVGIDNKKLAKIIGANISNVEYGLYLDYFYNKLENTYNLEGNSMLEEFKKAGLPLFLYDKESMDGIFIKKFVKKK